MTKKELLKRLQDIQKNAFAVRESGYFPCPESDHREADEALLGYIDDIEVTHAFNRFKAWNNF